MFLSHNEKLENSEVIGEQVLHKIYFYVRSPKKRLKSILSFLLITGISLYLKINSPNPIWETFVIATLVSIVSMILLHLFTYSVYERNHPNFCKNLEFINKTAKLFLFNDAIRLFKLKLETFVEKYDTGRNYLEILFDAIFKLDGDSWDILIGVFNDAVVPTVSFFVAIIVFIPVFFYFLAFNIDLIKKIIPWLIPIVNVVVYFKWLFKKNDIFYHYEQIEEKKYLVTKRRITIKGYNCSRFIIKFILSIIVGFGVYLIMEAFNLNLYKSLFEAIKWLFVNGKELISKLV